MGELRSSKAMDFAFQLQHEQYTVNRGIKVLWTVLNPAAAAGAGGAAVAPVTPSP